MLTKLKKPKNWQSLAGQRKIFSLFLIFIVAFVIFLISTYYDSPTKDSNQAKSGQIDRVEECLKPFATEFTNHQIKESLLESRTFSVYLTQET